MTISRRLGEPEVLVPGGEERQLATFLAATRGLHFDAGSLVADRRGAEDALRQPQAPELQPIQLDALADPAPLGQPLEGRRE